MKKFPPKSHIESSQSKEKVIEKKVPDKLLKKMWEDNKGVKISNEGFKEIMDTFIKKVDTPINFLYRFVETSPNCYTWKPKPDIFQNNGIILSSTHGDSCFMEMEYKSTDGLSYTYYMENDTVLVSCSCPHTSKVAKFMFNVCSDEELITFRAFLQENESTPIVLLGNISNTNILPSDIENIIAISGYTNISGSKFEDSLTFPVLEDIGDYFYYTDKSRGESIGDRLSSLLPKIPDEEKEMKCMELNFIEYDFYDGAQVMNKSMEVRINNKGNPEKLFLYTPFSKGIREDMLWFQDLIQGIKNISSLYLVFLDKNNIPNNPQYIEHRKHMLYLNKIEAVIKIPAGIALSNENDNYIIVSKPQAIGGTPKDILFIDFTKKFPKDIKKTISIIDDFLRGELHITESYYKAVSKYSLIEPNILEPSLYV